MSTANKTAQSGARPAEGPSPAGKGHMEPADLGQKPGVEHFADPVLKQGDWLDPQRVWRWLSLYG